MAELLLTPLFNNAGLVSYWPLNGNSNDAKGASNGTDTNITYSVANGKYNQGAGYNGSSSKIVLSIAQPTSSYTIVSWLSGNNTVADANYRIWDSQESGATPNTGATFVYNPSLGGSTKNLRVYHNNGAWSTSNNLSNVLDTNKYQHVALAWDGSTTRFYLNGTYVGGGAYSTAITNGGNADIGHGRATGTFWNGAIDDVAIFNTALSQEQIQFLSNQPHGNLLTLGVG